MDAAGQKFFKFLCLAGFGAEKNPRWAIRLGSMKTPQSSGRLYENTPEVTGPPGRL